VGVEHGHGHVPVSEKLLHRADVMAVRKQMCREAVAKRRTGGRCERCWVATLMPG
jgi:hypothetical protein